MNVAQAIEALKKLPTGKKVLLEVPLLDKDQEHLPALLVEVFERDQEFVLLRGK